MEVVDILLKKIKTISILFLLLTFKKKKKLINSRFQTTIE